MRKVTWWLLLGLTFSIPWEYSLDLGPPFGNVSRILGVAVLLAMVPAVLEARGVRRLHALHWLVLALLAWFAASYFWSVDPDATVVRVRGYLQVTMIAWFVWELAETPEDLRDLLRAYVAGCCVLAVMTIANFALSDAAAQIRFAAEGQDPNEVARFLDLGFPLGALLVSAGSRWRDRFLAVGYVPLGLLGVLLTASRTGLIASLVALAGCGFMLARSRRSRAIAGLAAPVVLLTFLYVVPGGTVSRMLSIYEELTSGNLNQRLNIWAAGWRAFSQAPFAGAGAGTFLSAAHLPLGVTAHNTALAVAVEGGNVALAAAAAIVVLAVGLVLAMGGNMRLGLGTAFLVWMVAAMVLSVQENRSTWLLLGIIVTASRLSGGKPEEFAREFSEPRRASVCSSVALASE
jgi:O-antigen ligase